MDTRTTAPLNIAVVGTGIAGMSSAWLLSQCHRVTVYEKDDRLGGHSNTVEVEGPDGPIAVDTGFIVYNERTYPNLVALFNHLSVATYPTDMSFAASLDGGRFEYAGSGLRGLLAQPQNILRPRMWRMLRDIARFYREAPVDVRERRVGEMTLRDYLRTKGYGSELVYDHLLPMGAAIWSTPLDGMLDYPLVAFVRFCENHGLLQIKDRPVWRTVEGGSREYVRRLTAGYAGNTLLNTAVTGIRRTGTHVWVDDRQGTSRRFDHVVIAAHANQALALLTDADAAERRLLGAFRYERNLAILHSDPALMPLTRRAWSSWNFLSQNAERSKKVAVSYWMNRLQRLPRKRPLFLTLNPVTRPRQDRILRSFIYEHPLYDMEAIRAQRLLWNLQGARRTWFCGSYCGHGFHEDALQAGLAVAEQLGSLKRPWKLADPNSRIHCYQTPRGVASRGEAA